MTSVSRFKTKNFQTHNRSGVQYNKQLGLFILFTMKCYKTVFTWIQENTFFFVLLHLKNDGVPYSYTQN